MRSRLITFFVAYILWSLLSFSFDWQHATVGFFVALLVSASVGDMFTDQANKWFEIHRYGWFLVYIAVFTWQCIKANFDVACRVLNPRLPINPGIIKVKTKLKTETALTFLANSITLTPGTFSVDVDKRKGYLYIHWIDIKTRNVDEASEIIVSKFEKILKQVFE
jgi:multicomponent Na+:H+ antiporter subunit E